MREAPVDIYTLAIFRGDLDTVTVILIAILIVCIDWRFLDIPLFAGFSVLLYVVATHTNSIILPMSEENVFLIF